MSYLATATPRIFGHRGAAALAPENTLPSFRLGEALGAQYLELDVRGTEDGCVLVLHDERLDRTTDGEGAVREWSWSKLSHLDAGYRFSHDGNAFPFRGHGIRIPVLESVLQAFPEGRFNIEIKQADPPIADEVVALLRRHGAADRTLLAAEDDAIMQSIRRSAGEQIVTGSSTGDVLAFMERVQNGAWADYRHPGVALQIPPRFGDRELITGDTVAAAHRIGVEVHAWTINDPDEMRRLLELGVDGIISDVPGLAHAVAGGLRSV